MPDPEDKKELGGLARSIDSLFSGQGAGKEGALAEPEPEPDSGLEPLGDAGASPLPASATDVAEPDAWDPFGPAAAESEAEIPERERAPSTGAAAAEHDGPSPLELAVEAYLQGGRDAARIRSLVTGHVAALEFEPVAAAVERLVLGVGDPPDRETIDLVNELLSPIVTGRLVKRLGQEREEQRRSGYHRICSTLGLPMARALRDELAEASDLSARRAYFDALVAMGEAGRPVVEEMAEDENRFLARNGVAILGELGGPRAEELVLAALANPDPRVRREGLLQMARLRIADQDRLILALLDDTDDKVRLAAVHTAAEMRVERAVRPLVAMLDGSHDPEVLVPVLDALGRIGDPGAVPSIEKHATRDLFGKPPTEVRVEAYRALAHIGTPHARSVLERAVDDKDPVVRRVAKELTRKGR